jgi:CRP/FNR family transcriptional regulator, cyclic AMP receptor protein
MYIVRSGHFVVTKARSNTEVVLAELAPGGIVGEMGLFDRQNRSANVKATKDSEVVCLPYKTLEQQLAQLPEWLRAVMRSMNQNIRESNKKLKQLGASETVEQRFSPHQINKLLAILNFVGRSYGEKSEKGLVVPSGTLRKFTIQVFHEPTNKMMSLLESLQRLGYFEVEDLGEGKQFLVNKNADFLFQFAEWFNDYLMKSEQDRIKLSVEDAVILRAIAKIALKKTTPQNPKLNLVIEEVCQVAPQEAGFPIKADHFNLFITRRLISDKKLIQNKVCVECIPSELLQLAENFIFAEKIQAELK